jgi:fibronectin-binding autotransporter adhesin
MVSIFSPRSVPIAIASLFLLSTAANAANYTWDSDGVDPPSDGAGNWDPVGGTNWSDGVTLGPWGNTTNDIAIFGVANGAAGTINVGSVIANGITFNPPGSGSYTLTGGTITLGGTSPTITSNAAAAINSTIAGASSLIKAGAGTLNLSGNNTYTGTTRIDGGILNVATLANYGSDSSIGNRSLAQESAAGDNIGLWFRGGTLQYTGTTAQSTDRHMRISNAGATIDASGANPAATLSFTQSGTNINLFENPGTRTITLTGTNTGDNHFALQIMNQASNPTSLVKAGVGTWRLDNGNSNYSGGTTISQGTIRTGHRSALGTGPVSIANGANLLLSWNSGDSTISNNITLNGPGGSDNKTSIYADGGGGSHPEFTLAGTLTLNATSNLGGNDANNLRVSGQITGPGGLTKGGGRPDENNTLVLANSSNNYAGNTAITKGRVLLAASEVIPHGPGAGTVSIAAGTSLDLGGHSETINNLSGAGTVTSTASIASPVFFTNDAGTGLSAANTYTHKINFGSAPGTTVNGVTFDNAGVWTLAGATLVAGNTSTGATGNIAAVLERFNYNGNPGILTLSGLAPGQTYEARLYQRRWGVGDRTQLFTLTSGAQSATMVYNEDASATPSYLGFRYTADASGTATIQTNIRGNGSYHWYGATNQLVDAPTLTVGDASDSTFSGTITSNLALTKQGTGTQTLSGNNNFTGAITVNGGVLRGSSVGAFGAANSARTITVNNGTTLEFNANGVFGGHANANVPSLIINGGTVINTSGNNPLNNITLNGGTLTATAGNGASWQSWNINGTVTSTGESTISGTGANTGILLASGTPTNTNFDVQSGTLTVSTAIFDGRAAASPFAARATSLTKLGTGTLTLSGTNTYSGTTTINDGTLVIAQTGSITSHTTINPAGTLTVDGSLTGNVTVNGGTLDGNGTITGQLTVGSGGVVAPGNSLGVLTVTGGPLTLNLGATLQMELANPLAQGIAPSGNLFLPNGNVNPAAITGGAPVGPPGLVNDRVVGNLTFNPGSTLQVLTLDGLTPGNLQKGLAWKIIDGAITTDTGGFLLPNGSFTFSGGGLPGNFISQGGINLDFPDLWDGQDWGYYNWDLSLFESHGILVLVPEPSRPLLLALALTPLVLRRRRRP